MLDVKKGPGGSVALGWHPGVNMSISFWQTHRKRGPCLEDHPRTWIRGDRITLIYRPSKGHLEGEQPYLGDFLIMVINHLISGMILQVVVD